MKEYDPTTSKKGQQISLKIKRLGINGEGIAIIKINYFRSWGATERRSDCHDHKCYTKFAEGTLQSVKSC